MFSKFNKKSDSETEHCRMMPDCGSTTRTPRWVKVFGVIAIILLLLFVILHLAGGGLGEHRP